MITLVIGITTYKRPAMLEAALRSLIDLDTDVCVHVLVADNDPSGREGVKVSERIRAAGYRFPLTAIVVEGRGFTYGRNAILKTAIFDWSSDFVVTMDDDQSVAPGFIKALLEVQAKTCADIVGPAVWPAFDVPPPGWARRCKVYHRNTKTTGNVKLLYGDGGVLMSSSLAKLMPFPWYDHSFALTGGADAELFLRLESVGARFARAAGAIIHEGYPASRVTVLWALQRAYRIGSTDMMIARKHRRRTITFVIDAAKIVGAFAVAPTLFLVYLGQAGRQVDALCKLARACGKAAALLGWQYREYAKIHGS